MSSLTIVNSDFQEPKLVEADLTIYKLIAKESSLVLLFKAFAKNEGSRSDMLYLICTTKWHSGAILKNARTDEGFDTH